MKAGDSRLIFFRLLLWSLVLFFLKNSLQHLKNLTEQSSLLRAATWKSSYLSVSISGNRSIPLCPSSRVSLLSPVSQSILICFPLPFGRDLNSMIRFFILFSNLALSNNWGVELNKRERKTFRVRALQTLSYRSCADTPGSVNGF